MHGVYLYIDSWEMLLVPVQDWRSMILVSVLVPVQVWGFMILVPVLV